MAEEFKSRENQEDVADIMSSLIREIAESQRDLMIAQMLQNAKDLWLKGERAAAYWILEAFKQGEDHALNSLRNADTDAIETVSREVTGDLWKEDNLRSKFIDIQQKMGSES